MFKHSTNCEQYIPLTISCLPQYIGLWPSLINIPWWQSWSQWWWWWRTKSDMWPLAWIRCCTWSQTGSLLSTQQPTFSSTASLAPSSDRWSSSSITNHIERKKFKFLEQYITLEVYGPSGPLDFIPSRPSSGSTRHKMQETKNKLNNMMGRPIAFNKLKKTNIVKNE